MKTGSFSWLMRRMAGICIFLINCRTERLPRGQICVQSFHKVTGALTQSSVLHIGTGRVDKRRVERALKLVQSTSPSYLLMASLDAARYELAVRGEDMMERSLSLSDELRKGIRQIPGMSCMNSGLAGKYGYME